MIHDAVVHKITRRNPFLQDWPYYGIIDILNPVATAQYQHGVTISTKPGMMHDFRDLRFFQADGTEMPFWNESQTAGSTSFNWIKPYSASQRKAYVFYGNREAVSQSSGDKTFEFFDDFLGSSLDAAKWSSSGSGIAVAGSILTITGQASAASTITGLSSYGTNYAIRGNFKCAAFYTGAYSFTRWSGTNNHISISTSNDDATYDGYYASKKDGSDGAGVSLGMTSGEVTNYRAWDLIRKSTTNVLVRKSSATVLDYSTTAYIPTGSLVPLIETYGNLGGNAIYYDWILVRKYTATEPVCQLNQSGLRNPIYR